MMSFPSLAKSTSTLDLFFQKVSLKQQHRKTTINPSLQRKNDNYILIVFLIKTLQKQIFGGMASLNFLPSPQKVVNSEKSDLKFGYFLLNKIFVHLAAS
jgi:hypothetical protein